MSAGLVLLVSCRTPVARQGCSSPAPGRLSGVTMLVPGLKLGVKSSRLTAAFSAELLEIDLAATAVLLYAAPLRVGPEHSRVGTGGSRRPHLTFAFALEVTAPPDLTEGSKSVGITALVVVGGLLTRAPACLATTLAASRCRLVVGC